MPDEKDPPVVIAEIISGLVPEHDYEIVDDGRTAHLTNTGLLAVEAALDLDLYHEDNVDSLTAVNVALHAHALLHRDVDYIVRDGKVDLVDEFRGRVAQRRRWPDGLQAAVEAKEGLDATAEGEVLGTITVQALVNLYRTRSGM